MKNQLIAFMIVCLAGLASQAQKIKGGADVGFTYGEFYTVTNYNQTTEIKIGEKLYKSYPHFLNKPVTFWCLADSGRILRSKNKIEICAKSVSEDGVPRGTDCKMDYFGADRQQIVPSKCLRWVELGSDAGVCAKFEWTPAPATVVIKTLLDTATEDIPHYTEVGSETYTLPDCQ